MREQFARFIEMLSFAERDAYCGREGDSKNGFYTRKFETMFGKIDDVKLPRIRSGFLILYFISKEVDK